MNKIQTFTQFLTTQSIQIPIWGFIFNLILAAILSYILGRVYIKYGKSLSNRRVFAKNFILMTMTTMVIIVIVKSSLALSLGLVGALSIVRFRSAIKEPEELSYLFLSIAIGLGLGADQTIITVIGFAIINILIVLKNYEHRKEDNQNLYLTITSCNPQKIRLDQIVEILKKYCSAVDLKRFDETKETLEATFLVEFDDLQKFYEGKSELQNLNEHLKITFIDNKGLI